MNEAGAAAAETALRKRLFSDFVDGEEVPEHKREVLGTVQELLERTILQGEGNSVLITGPRGSGKSWVLEYVFNALQSDKRCRDNYVRVNLSGIIHTDDRLALIEIARKLNCEDKLEEYTSLSFAAALDYLLTALRSGSNTNKSVIFVLDEFDQFVNHKNQSLLYNLFDFSQSPHNPIAVVGLTCRLDVIELLEKRVKSRFSHRQLLLFPQTVFEDYVSLTHSLLSLPHDFQPQQYRCEWQANLEEVLQNATVLRTLQRQFRISADIRSLKTLLLFPVSRLSQSRPFVSPSNFSLSLELLHRDSLGAVLKGVTVLELCLLVAATQVSEVSCGEPVNFEMVYSEYRSFAQRAQSMDVLSHPVALKAFDHLLALELLVPVSETSLKQQHHQLRQFTLVQSVLSPDQVTRAVVAFPCCPVELVRWATVQPLAQ